MSEKHHDARAAGGAPPLLWFVAALLALPELLFQLAEAGLLSDPSLRWNVMAIFGFWDRDFDAALAGGPAPAHLWLSLLSHAFLHGGAFHLIMNGVIFLALGNVLVRVLGAARFLALFGVTAIAGALAFGLIAQSNGPMVGASGVVFGFFGALKSWEWRYIRATGAPANRFWGTIAALVVMNVALALFYPAASIAWEAHLGGFIAGFVAARWLAPGVAGPSPI